MKGCRFQTAAECAVAIECEHGFDVCPTCDPCTCMEITASGILSGRDLSSVQLGYLKHLRQRTLNNDMGLRELKGGLAVTKLVRVLSACGAVRTHDDPHMPESHIRVHLTEKGEDLLDRRRAIDL